MNGLPTFEKGEAMGVVLVLSIGLTALAGTLDAGPLAGVFAVAGFAVLLPLTAVLGERLPYVASEADEGGATTGADRVAGDAADGERDHAVAKLRDRYARGEIGEAEFERKLERLLETEDLDGTVGAADERDRLSELE
ncbi:MAG: SHOCT domain-containing protein [Haloarculaceae archaeon]